MDTYETRKLIIEAMGESCLIDNIEGYFGKWAIEDCYRNIIGIYGIEIEEVEDDEE